MKPVKTILCAVLTLCLLAAATSPGWAWDNYLMVRGGAYLPQGDVDDLDPGPAVELAYGFDIIPFLSGELSAGYYTAEKDDDTLTVVPVALTGKLHLPIPVITPYALAGGGAYYADADISGAGTDDDIVFGYHLGAGVNFKLPLLIFSLEGKYFAAEPSLYDTDVAIDGYVVTLGAGLKF